MANVNIKFNGKDYLLSCDEGQEQNLKHKLEKVNLEAMKKFENQNKFTQKVDELNQETDSLIEEIDKWQT